MSRIGADIFMRLLTTVQRLAVVAACVCGGAAQAATPEDWPSFSEVYGLARSNLTGVSEADFNRMAVKGLLDELKPLVSVVTGDAPAATSPGAAKLSKTTVYDDAFGYFRVASVSAGLASELAAAYEKLSASNKLSGLVLDLRFADGEEYAEAAAAADRFQSKEKPLLSWAAETARSTPKSDAWRMPVTVLINRQTSSAAEALAAVLRQTEVALLIGTTTAGQASLFKEFPLANGQRLKIAAAPVKLGDGQSISGKGVSPDIQVNVNPEDERAYFADAFKLLAKAGAASASAAGPNLLAGASGTNRPPRRRINEAELVRMQREGIDPEAEGETVPGRAHGDANKPVVTDPVLARALDLLKGLAVVQKVRPL